MSCITINITLGRQRELQADAINLKISALRQPNLRLHRESSFEAPTLCHARLDAGTKVNIGAFCSIASSRIGWVSIGRYGAIADEVRIGANEHPVDRLTACRLPHVPHMHEWHKTLEPEQAEYVVKHPYHFYRACPITEIGNDVWIGYGAFIKAGVKIGDGAIIGAKATVINDIPPYAIAVGTPAKVKRFRFPEETVERLMALQWWQYRLYDMFGKVQIDKIDYAIPQIEELVAEGKLKPFQGRVFSAEDLATGT